MPPPRAASAEDQQSPDQIAAAVETFLAQYPRALVSEEGKVLFDMRNSKYSLSTEYGRCTLQFWSEDRNLVRRVVRVAERRGVLRLSTQRFGQAKSSLLELTGEIERRTISSRETERTGFLVVLRRMLARLFPEWTAEAFRTAMDLEKSFGPAYARGLLTQGQHAWAVISVNEGETQATIDGVLTLGVLWLTECRDKSGGRRVVRGLKILLPRGTAALTAARLPWMNHDAAQWELWEYDPRTEEVTERDTTDAGNLQTHLLQAVDQGSVQERFADASSQVLGLVPAEWRDEVEPRVRSGAELAFLINGLEFARARTEFAGQSFERRLEITVGAASRETPLTESNAAELRARLVELFTRRQPLADTRDPLYRMQTERWLESVLRRDMARLDAHLDPGHVYAQVPALAGADRGMLDLLSVLKDGRLAVIELKAEEDLHLALQGLDYWVRVRWHHTQTPNSAYGSGLGLGEFQRHGYFPGVALSDRPPRLYLVAPALRVHPATEIVLRHLSPKVDWELAALDERWREQVRVVWRKRSGAAFNVRA